MQESTKNIITTAGFDIREGVMTLEVPELDKITRDMKKVMLTTESPSREEIRNLVNLFYQVQDMRISIAEQIRSINRLSGNDTNTIVLSWSLKSAAAMEKGINDCLKCLCENNRVGKWLLGIKGIGPVLAAGCLGYFDITNKQYASQFISYAGLNDNNRPWLGVAKSKEIINAVMDSLGTDKVTDDVVLIVAAKTQWKFDYLRENAFDPRKEKWSKDKLEKACAKIPYNAGLKTHLWKIGKSFEYQKTREGSVYGRLLAERIVQEITRNEAGKNKELIAKKLSEKNYTKGTDTYNAYMEGKLPMPEINARSRRWVEKIFVSHLFEEMYRVAYDKIPPRYYALEHCDGHHDEIAPEVPYTKVTGEE
jgi:hypothetical protein